jgi:SAM-dependent methyltransferase
VSTFSQRFAELPEDLVVKVNGSKDEGLFVHVGRCVVEVLEKEVGELWKRRDMLDFGCGLGRVLKPLIERAPYANLVGFDIDAAMLESCRRLLGDERLRLVSTTRELPDKSFDLVFAISVFTHLNKSADYWLEEIDRLLRPNGLAFLTFQDEALFSEMASAGKIEGLESGNTVLERRFIVGAGTVEGGAGMGTFLSTKEWEATVGRFFKVLVTVPRGLFGHQSYSVLAKRIPGETAPRTITRP